jgi:hypothetical protein
MVLVMTGVFLIANISLMFNIIYYNYLQLNKLESVVSHYLNFDFNNLISSISTGVNLFVYIKFNRVFRKDFLDLLGKLTPCFSRVQQGDSFAMLNRWQN